VEYCYNIVTIIDVGAPLYGVGKKNSCIISISYPILWKYLDIWQEYCL